MLTLSACVGNEHMSFLDPQGPIAYDQSVHFYWVLGIMAVFVAGPIFLALPFLVWRYRYGNTAARYTPKWCDSTPIVALTWIGPVLIVCALGFLVWRDSHHLNPSRPIASRRPPLAMQVIGYDWKWLFIYPEQGIATIGGMTIPIGRPVSIHLTSATVMQSFFIPALGSQIYAMGGMVTRLNLEASRAGRFLGENTMYDGNGFHQQKFTAVGASPAAFKAWVRKVKATGVPIDARILRLIGERNTHAQLIAALPRRAVHDGVVYLTGVSPRLFRALVEAVKNGAGPGPKGTAEPKRSTPVAAANATPTREKTEP
ncbi:MAG: cytochrome ubiquinol oxidase subunit II [Steroidobacteraceae bacterium]